jgi:hypothetical protein
LGWNQVLEELFRRVDDGLEQPQRSGDGQEGDESGQEGFFEKIFYFISPGLAP